MTAAPDAHTPLLDEALRLAIESRLTRARAAFGGDGDQTMIGRCKRALSGDPGAIRSFLTAIADEQVIGGAR